MKEVEKKMIALDGWKRFIREHKKRLESVEELALFAMGLAEDLLQSEGEHRHLREYIYANEALERLKIRERVAELQKERGH